jgi:uncharacterized protein with NAD-binding domain and iron-sulfur cluster
MAAAFVLAKAGCKVTVFEKASLIGGKVSSYDENGKSYEHGIHGWWHNYNNFIGLLRAVGVDDKAIFKQVSGSNMIETSGKRYPLKKLNFPLPSPLFMAWQTLSAPYLSLKDVISLLKFGVILLGFDPRTDYERYDALSFQELMDECRVSTRFQQLVLTPFILSFDFTIPDRVSAACGLSGMHFYVIRDQDAVCTRWLKGTPQDLVFGPLQKRLEEQYKVTFMTSAKVTSINVDAACKTVTGCDVSSPAFKCDSEQLIASVDLSVVPPEGFAKVDGYGILIGRLNGTITAFDNTCTHNGCSVAWSDTDKLFECPCHGGRYNPNGTVASGPPPQALAKLDVEANGNTLYIKSYDEIKTFAFDEIVLASDVVNAKDVLLNSLPATHRINQTMSKMDTTPVVVVRMWFAGNNYEPQIDSAITPLFNFIDNFFNLNSFSSSYDNQGHIIEVQSYRVFGTIDNPDDELLALALADLQLINKQYCAANLSGFRINRHKQLFTRYAPRLNRFRPKEKSGIEGLYFAGDWTGFDYPVWMMERGISSGIRAANTICKKHGAAEYPLLKLARGGVLFRLTCFVSRLLVKIGRINFSGVFAHWLRKRKHPELHVLPRAKDGSGLYFEKPAALTWYDWIIQLLQISAEIEHSLMVQYLFAGYSITPTFASPEYDMVTGWKSMVLGIAVEEMGHWLSVQGVLKFLGAPTHLQRENYPYRSEFYPFPFELERFSKGTLAKYIIAEMPALPLTDELKEILERADLKLFDNRLNNVGILYEDIISILSDTTSIPDSCIKQINDLDTVFGYWSFAHTVIASPITGRASALDLMKKIAEQGEGVESSVNSHFERFLSIYRAFDTVDQFRLPFLTANVQPNPTLTGNTNRITEQRAVLWAKVFNLKYELTIAMIDCLLNTSCNPATQRLLLDVLHTEMSGKSGHGGLRQIADRLFYLPLLQDDLFGAKAGPTFELPDVITMPTSMPGCWSMLKAKAGELLDLLTFLAAFDTENAEAMATAAMAASLLHLADQQLQSLIS